MGRGVRVGELVRRVHWHHLMTFGCGQRESKRNFDGDWFLRRVAGWILMPCVKRENPALSTSIP